MDDDGQTLGQQIGVQGGKIADAALDRNRSIGRQDLETGEVSGHVALNGAAKLLPHAEIGEHSVADRCAIRLRRNPEFVRITLVHPNEQGE